MRKSKSDDMLVIQHFPKALELVLLKETNLTRTDFQGRRVRERETREPRGFFARIRAFVPGLSRSQPIITEREWVEPGMSEREVLEYLVLHDEHEQMKDERAKAEARRAKQQARSQ